LLGYVIAAIELFGGLAILIGVKTRWVAWAFVVYVIIVTALGHPFWTMDGAARAANQANFYKNLAIMAAYLLLAITGAGRYSVDHRPALVPSTATAASA
jgi:putative oxidoreductase